MVIMKHQFPVRVSGEEEAKKQQSAIKRNVAMFTRAVWRKCERLVLVKADHTRNSMMRKSSSEAMDTARPTSVMISRTPEEISLLAMRTENDVRWLHSHRMRWLSLLLTLHPTSDQSFAVGLQKTQRGLWPSGLSMGKSSLMSSDGSLLSSSVTDIKRLIGTASLKLFLNLSIRFFTATVFSIPVVLIIFTSMSNTDILQSLLEQNLSSKFWLLNSSLLLILMFFTKLSTECMYSDDMWWTVDSLTPSQVLFNILLDAPTKS